MAMTTCKECGKQVSTGAKTCPHCGTSAPAKKKGKGGIGKWLLIVFAIGLVAAILPKKDKATPVASAPPKAPTVRAVEAPKAPAPVEEKLTEGQQKALDEVRASTARLAKLNADAREQWDAETKEDAKLLRGCLEHQVCDSGTYPRLLREKPRAFVNDILGDPASVQNIGGSEIHYFSVPTTDGRKRAKLQLSYKNFAVDSVNVYQ
ncbi:MAG: zinc ribbon domain-containing protein [Xanthomonadaceae bacterium]|nr:zinc ribbon domain-containing protein [Xanthomonadaceae bacterium]